VRRKNERYKRRNQQMKPKIQKYIETCDYYATSEKATIKALMFTFRLSESEAEKELEVYIKNNVTFNYGQA
jgi:hypothetical protein